MAKSDLTAINAKTISVNGAPIAGSAAAYGPYTTFDQLDADVVLALNSVVIQGAMTSSLAYTTIDHLNVLSGISLAETVKYGTASTPASNNATGPIGIGGGGTPTPTPTPALSAAPSSPTFATSQPAGTSITSITGMGSGETVRRISPNDGRIVVNSAGTGLVVGLSASAAGTKNYMVTTSLGNRLTIAVTATQALSAGQRSYTVTNPNASVLSNYAVSMTIPFVAGMAADFSDLRVYAADGSTLIPFGIESYVAATSVNIRFAPPTLAASGTLNIKIGFGNAGAAGGSNIASVFTLGDTLSSATIDNAKWTQTIAVDTGTARTSLTDMVAQQVFPANIPASPESVKGIQGIASDGKFNPATGAAGTLAVCWSNAADTAGVIDLHTITPGASAPVFVRTLTTTAPDHPAGAFFRPDNGNLVVGGGNGIKEYNVDTGLVQSWSIAGDTTNFAATLAGVTQVEGEDANVVWATSFTDVDARTSNPYRFAKLRLNSDGTYTSLGVWTLATDGTYGGVQGVFNADGDLYFGATDANNAHTAFLNSNFLCKLTLNLDGTATAGPKIGFPSEHEIEGMHQDPSGRLWVCTTGDSYRQLWNVSFGHSARLSLVTPGGKGGTSQRNYLTSVATFDVGSALVYRGRFAGTYPCVQFGDIGGTPPFASSNAVGFARVSNNSLKMTPRTIVGGTETRQSTLTADMDLHTYEVRRYTDRIVFMVDGVQVGSDVTANMPTGALPVQLGSGTATSSTSGGAVYPRFIGVRPLAAQEPTVALAAGVGSLTVASVVPTPGQVFSTAITGLSSGSTASATSSDGTTLAVSGSTLSGTWPIAASGTNPIVTIVENKTDGTVLATTIALAVATLWTPAALNPAHRLRFDTGVTTSGSAISSVVDQGSLAGTYTGTSLTLASAVAAANDQPGAVFNGTASKLTGDAAMRALLNAAPGITYYGIMLPGAPVPVSMMTFGSGASGTGTRSSWNLVNNKVSSVNRTTDAQSPSNDLSGATTLAQGTVHCAIVTHDLPSALQEIRVDGAVDATGALTTGAAYPASNSQAATIGVSGSGTSNYQNGTIMEVGAVRGVLTASDKLRIEGYAKARYTAPVAAGHAFETYPPTVLRLARTTAASGVAFSAQIAGLPASATGVTATSSDGTVLTVSGGVVSGTFSTAGSRTVTLTATYNGVALSGTSTVTVS